MTTRELIRPQETVSSATTGTNSIVKTILVHIQDSESATQRIETALTIARATSAHVTCLQVTAVEAYVAFDGFGGLFVMGDVMKAIDDEAARLRAELEKDLRDEEVSWDYVQLTGHVTGELLYYGALADLVVTSREPRSNEIGVPTLSLLGDLLQSSRTPMFLPGSDPFDPTGPALIAWDGSFEAANAVRASLGMLKLASSVKVLHIASGPHRNDAFPGTRLLEYLSRHGIHAELVVETYKGADDDVVAAAILSHARSSGAFVVMGGYGHSRVREFLFGGVTRTFLAESNVPVVIAR